MLKSLIAGETGALDAVDFVVRMKQKRDKLFANYADLRSQVDSAMISCARFLFLIAAIDLIALAADYLFPKLEFVASLLLPLSGIPVSGFCIYTALSTLRKLGGAFRDGVIMVDEFRHELQISKNSDAEREITLMCLMGEIEILPDFTRLTRFSNFMLWFCAGGAGVVFVILVFLLFYSLFYY